MHPLSYTQQLRQLGDAERLIRGFQKRISAIGFETGFMHLPIKQRSAMMDGEIPFYGYLMRSGLNRAGAASDPRESVETISSLHEKKRLAGQQPYSNR